MKVAVTGATGFLGRYIVRQLLEHGHTCRCWFRSQASCYQVADAAPIEWLPGELGDARATAALPEGCDALVHSGLYRVGSGFQGGEGDLLTFVEKNVLGSVALMQAVRAAGVRRFVFLSTCAVHDCILDDRPLDENHPLRAKSHYGAHKAAVEQFVHSFGLGQGEEFCALRPCGIYGLHHEPRQSRWYDLVHAVARGEPVTCRGGAKVVHASDVANAVRLLLQAESVAGEVYSCCGQYVSDYDVACLAAEISRSGAEIQGASGMPRHTIVCDKLRSLGFEFGGRPLLAQTIREMLAV